MSEENKQAVENEESAKDRLLSALPYLRNAITGANNGGVAQLAILRAHEDGSGQIVCRFDCAEFFADLAEVLDAPAQTEEDDLRAEARRFIDKFGLKKYEEY